MNTRKQPRGFTLIEIMIVVAIIAIVLAIALPGFVNARRRSRAIACQENLIRIDQALQQYVIQENRVATDDLSAEWPDSFVGQDLYIRAMPVCPAGGTYQVTIPDLNEPVTCTIVDNKHPHRLPWAAAGT